MRGVIKGKDRVDEGTSGSFAFSACNMDDVEVVKLSDFMVRS